jgi:hypothetical protein
VFRDDHLVPCVAIPGVRDFRNPRSVNVLLSEWAIARTPFRGPWRRRARRRLHRDLFRLADEESMLNGQHDRLLHGVVR